MSALTHLVGQSDFVVAVLLFAGDDVLTTLQESLVATVLGGPTKVGVCLDFCSHVKSDFPTTVVGKFEFLTRFESLLGPSPSVGAIAIVLELTLGPTPTIAVATNTPVNFDDHNQGEVSLVLYVACIVEHDVVQTGLLNLQSGSIRTNLEVANLCPRHRAGEVRIGSFVLNIVLQSRAITSLLLAIEVNNLKLLACLQPYVLLVHTATELVLTTFCSSVDDVALVVFLGTVLVVTGTHHSFANNLVYANSITNNVEAHLNSIVKVAGALVFLTASNHTCHQCHSTEQIQKFFHLVLCFVIKLIKRLYCIILCYISRTTICLPRGRCSRGSESRWVSWSGGHATTSR